MKSVLLRDLSLSLQTLRVFATLRGTASLDVCLPGMFVRKDYSLGVLFYWNYFQGFYI
ncbi:hypothetical protein LEP1GSC202_3719 [Leptospira yanagawae serovar Saopaulo str. Sao Paulo = ATCC 700523]|uniref:Uncharacterized protein n=1 Tax=Leptospira yanagawae serovar Saopaulo str. Sao Paulo = ATCC 700523 TaxID=1249483 RepID=A0A5E8HHT1_9LEPT|nr:hypothetical protein LEP1GSC202_3719 [Leptospira yanagawae serovar Saopaulo str. Sao Paulo = ATCC 700523]